MTHSKRSSGTATGRTPPSRRAALGPSRTLLVVLAFSATTAAAAGLTIELGEPPEADTQAGIRFEP